MQTLRLVWLGKSEAVGASPTRVMARAQNAMADIDPAMTAAEKAALLDVEINKAAAAEANTDNARIARHNRKKLQTEAMTQDEGKTNRLRKRRQEIDMDVKETQTSNAILHTRRGNDVTDKKAMAKDSDELFEGVDNAEVEALIETKTKTQAARSEARDTAETARKSKAVARKAKRNKTYAQKVEEAQNAQLKAEYDAQNKLDDETREQLLTDEAQTQQEILDDMRGELSPKKAAKVARKELTKVEDAEFAAKKAFADKHNLDVEEVDAVLTQSIARRVTDESAKSANMVVSAFEAEGTPMPAAVVQRIVTEVTGDAEADVTIKTDDAGYVSTEDARAAIKEARDLALGDLMQRSLDDPNTAFTYSMYIRDGYASVKTALKEVRTESEASVEMLKARLSIASQQGRNLTDRDLIEMNIGGKKGRLNTEEYLEAALAKGAEVEATLRATDEKVGTSYVEELSAIKLEAKSDTLVRNELEGHGYNLKTLEDIKGEDLQMLLANSRYLQKVSNLIENKKANSQGYGISHV